MTASDGAGGPGLRHELLPLAATVGIDIDRWAKVQARDFCALVRELEKNIE